MQIIFFLPFNKNNIYLKKMVFNVGKIIVKKFDGSSWTTVGNPYFSIGAASSTLISFTSDDIPYVGFEDIYRSGKATVMKYQY